MKVFNKFFLILLLCSITLNVYSQVIDLSDFEIVCVDNNNKLILKSVSVLQEEITKRSGIKFPIIYKLPQNQQKLIFVGLENTLKSVSPNLSKIISDMGTFEDEGYKIMVNEELNNIIVVGYDPRGVLYGVGKLLRTMEIKKKEVLIQSNYQVVSTPRYSIRGHQLGYRPKTNSYDAWTVEQYDQYIRELALFGANSIEIVPPRTDDNARSLHMKLPPIEMIKRQSEICDSYGLDVWMWYPNMGKSYTHPDSINNEREERHDVFKALKRIDHIFIPGGDPGNLEPDIFFKWASEVSGILHQYHPKAGVWVSLQQFDEEQVEYSFKYIEENDPIWLRGLVSGPSSPDLAATRYRLPKKYKHRHYPDITHTVRCQYPTPQWDQAFALTLGREPYNPEPAYYANIHRTLEPFTDGSISYSEGINDDVNKFLWSCLDWNPEMQVNQILKEYSRFFFGIEDTDYVPDAILALEKNWLGPLENNGTIETTFAYWKQLELKYPELKNNWRWLQLLTRAYYDTYIRRRKIYEKNLEIEANNMLATASTQGADSVMKKALSTVYKAESEPKNQELKTKIEDFFEKSYHLIGSQTSIEKYFAEGSERGCMLDFIDYPLNNRWWLEDEFNKIKLMKTEKEKIERLEVIRNWENPGFGSYYDNISDISNSPHVQSQMNNSRGYAWWDQGKSRKRLSSQLYLNYPTLIYENLDPKATYTVRVAGEGEALLRVNGERVAPSSYMKELETFKEFFIPNKYVCGGKITLSFDEPEESSLNWRYKSKITDVWLLKNE